MNRSNTLVKTFIVVLAVVVLVGLLPSTAVAASKTVKIGVITTLSGPNASYGDNILKGIKLYMAQHEKELGDVKVELIVRDDAWNPDQARRLAQELIVRDQVSFLVGPISTPNVAAIAPLTVQAKVPFVLMVSGTSVLTTQSPFIVRCSFTVWAVGYTMGQWAAKHGYQTAYTAVPDYAGGLDYEAAFIKGYTDAGGKILGSVRMPMINSDYTPFMQRIKDAKPQAILSFVTGGKQSTGLIKAYADLGLAKAGIQMMGSGDITDDAELQNMGDGAIGIITAAHYSAGSTRPANKTFVASWKKAYGQDSYPNYMAVGAWDGMDMVFKAIREQKGQMDANRSVEIMKNYKSTTSPRGSLAIDPATRDVVQTVYIRKVEKRGGILVNAEFAEVPNVKDVWKELNPQK